MPLWRAQHEPPVSARPTGCAISGTHGSLRPCPLISMTTYRPSGPRPPEPGSTLRSVTAASAEPRSTRPIPAVLIPTRLTPTWRRLCPGLGQGHKDPKRAGNKAEKAPGGPNRRPRGLFLRPIFRSMKYWRRGGDSNSRYANQTHNAFRERRIQPLCHPSWMDSGTSMVDRIAPYLA